MLWFGRRYNGIPLVGAYLLVVVDSNGLSTLERNWRDIASETGNVIEIVTSREAEQRRNADYAEMPLDRVECGYIEPPASVAPDLVTPGVGCCYVHVNPGPTPVELQDYVNLSVDMNPAVVGGT